MELIIVFTDSTYLHCWMAGKPFIMMRITGELTAALYCLWRREGRGLKKNF